MVTAQSHFYGVMLIASYSGNGMIFFSLAAGTSQHAAKGILTEDN